MVNISFIGDISLNDDYIRLFREGVNPFQNLSDDLGEADLVVGNIECMSEGTKGENLQKKPRLKTDIDTLNFLKQINVGLACLAHNHVYDNLEDGFQKTTAFLEQNNIQYVGAAMGKSRSNSMLKIEINGILLAFINYVSSDTNPGIPPEADINLSILEKQEVLDDIAEAEDADFRILILHWGGKYENSFYPGPSQIRLAREFLTAGVDLIIGHHPHTLQPSLSYPGKKVFFSLGNFCFADIISDGRVKEIKYRRWKESAIVKVSFTKEGFQTSLVPFRLENLHTVKDKSVLYRLRFRQQYFNLIRISRLFWLIYYFGFKYLRPVVWELRRADSERSLLKRLFGLNRKKIQGMFK
ncbi:CapA family protein [Bacteroidota bacterium]